MLTLRKDVKAGIHHGAQMFSQDGHGGHSPTASNASLPTPKGSTVPLPG